MFDELNSYETAGGLSELLEILELPTASIEQVIMRKNLSWEDKKTIRRFVNSCDTFALLRHTHLISSVVVDVGFACWSYDLED